MSLKSLAGKVKNKAGKIIKGNNNADAAPEQSSEKKSARKLEKIATKVANTSKKIANVANSVNKISEEIKSTAEIASFQKDIQNLRKEGKITQDILDAILCENQNKLSLAYSEAIRAEAMGQPLPYLSEEEVQAALSVKNSVTKSVVRKVLKKV